MRRKIAFWHEFRSEQLCQVCCHLWLTSSVWTLLCAQQRNPEGSRVHIVYTSPQNRIDPKNPQRSIQTSGRYFGILWAAWCGALVDASDLSRVCAETFLNSATDSVQRHKGFGSFKDVCRFNLCKLHWCCVLCFMFRFVRTRWRVSAGLLASCVLRSCGDSACQLGLHLRPRFLEGRGNTANTLECQC